VRPTDLSSLDNQVASVLDQLDGLLSKAGSGFDKLVRVHVYGKEEASLEVFARALRRRTQGKAFPTLTSVVSGASDPRILISADVIAVAPNSASFLVQKDASVLPPGVRFFISGQADPGSSIAKATRKTMLGLGDTLSFLKLDRSRVVHVKVFLEPISATSEAQAEIDSFFGAGRVPPATFVEWTSSRTQPIEIELVVAGDRASAQEDSLSFLTPPALKASPIFSRVARVANVDLVFFSGLAGKSKTQADAQTEAIFDEYKSLFVECGTDFRHLAKATYYVSTSDTSTALNQIRPRFYDPQRPPAASKAMVRGVGEGQGIRIDFIAVKTKAQ
jgi:enamine deaminase RidA (YjgF/YER057c/UK114 family)